VWIEKKSENPTRNLIFFSRKECIKMAYSVPCAPQHQINGMRLCW
jgi:hypothetical protein